MLMSASLTGSYMRGSIELETNPSPRYSSFDRENRPPAAFECCKTEEECEIIYDNVIAQMALYDEEPLAFVHPRPPATHTA